jgi:hypothetical protein
MSQANGHFGSTAVHPYPVGNRQQWVGSGRSAGVCGSTVKVSSKSIQRSVDNPVENFPGEDRNLR